MNFIIHLLESVVQKIGKGVAWLLVVLLGVIFWDVGMRYAFKTTSAFFFELEWHIFSILFLLGAAYTLQSDKHVRVDVWYQNFSPKIKAWVNLTGSLCLLLPLCWIGITQSWPFVKTAYLLQETSADKGGLPARYLIKFCIPFCFILLSMQAMAEILRNAHIIFQDKQRD